MSALSITLHYLMVFTVCGATYSSVAFVGSNVYRAPEQISVLSIAVSALFVIKDRRLLAFRT